MKYAFPFLYSAEFLLVLIVTIGIWNNSRYGMAWDEPQQRLTGLVNYDFIANQSEELKTWHDRDYGVGIELPLIFAEKLFNWETTREIFTGRHLLTHLLFLISAYVFYRLAFNLFKNKWLALLGFLLIVSHPLLYGHSHFNSKDLPFLSVFIINLFLLHQLLQKNSITSALILGIAIGWILNIRLMGIMVPVVAITLLLVNGILNNRLKHQLKLILLLFSATAITLISTWPFLWDSPIQNFLYAFQNMSKFRFDREMLFMGSFIRPTVIPWYYIPVWFGITTPLPILILGFIGFVISGVKIIRKPIDTLSSSFLRMELSAFSFFIFPIIAVILLESVLYDSWRQMFFIYPPFILLILFGLHHVRKLSIKGFKFSIVIIGIAILQSATFIGSNLPNQHTYFNEFISLQEEDFAIKNFDNDYWGLSYKTGMEYILKNDSSPDVNLAVENMPGYLNEDMLTPTEEKRVHMKSIKDADYYLTEFRFHSFEKDSLAQLKWHSISAANSTILQIYKLK